MGHNLIFNGINTEDFGIIISGGGTFATPERDVMAIEVPGRNGEIQFDNGRFKNIQIVYSAGISKGFETKFLPFMRLMKSAPVYSVLTDDYHPDEYRLATFAADLVPDVGTILRSGHFDLVFNCKPQRFLKAGDIALPQIAGAGTPVNIIVAEGYAQDIFDPAFIALVGPRVVGNEQMTVFDLSSYSGKKLALYYPESRILRGTPVKGGTMSTDPTAGNGGGVSYGDQLMLYSSKVVISINTNYAAYETPSYFEILYSDGTLAASIFPTSETVMNPTLFPSKPLVKIGYSGALSGQPVCMINGSPVTLSVQSTAEVNGQTVSISDVTIDCETMDAYTEIPGYPYPYNQNKNVYIPSDIMLKPGENEIKVNNKISYVEIIPKWWTL